MKTAVSTIYYKNELLGFIRMKGFVKSPRPGNWKSILDSLLLLLPSEEWEGDNILRSKIAPSGVQYVDIWNDLRLEESTMEEALRWFISELPKVHLQMEEAQTKIDQFNGMETKGFSGMIPLDALPEVIATEETRLQMIDNLHEEFKILSDRRFFLRRQIHALMPIRNGFIRVDKKVIGVLYQSGNSTFGRIEIHEFDKIPDWIAMSGDEYFSPPDSSASQYRIIPTIND